LNTYGHRLKRGSELEWIGGKRDQADFREKEREEKLFTPRQPPVVFGAVGLGVLGGGVFFWFWVVWLGSFWVQCGSKG